MTPEDLDKIKRARDLMGEVFDATPMPTGDLLASKEGRDSVQIAIVYGDLRALVILLEKAR